MQHISYWMECDDCGDVLFDQSNQDILYAPSQRSLNMAAYSRGWFVSAVDDNEALCPDCRYYEDRS